MGGGVSVGDINNDEQIAHQRNSMLNRGTKTVGAADDSSISLALGKYEHEGLQQCSTQSDATESTKSLGRRNIEPNPLLVSDKDLNDPALRSAHRNPRVKYADQV